MATPTRACAHCGVDISHKRSDAKFCSPRCQGRFLYWNTPRRDRLREYFHRWRERNPDYIAPSEVEQRRWREEIRTCRYCEEKFTPKVHNQLDCGSSECLALRMRRRQRKDYQVNNYGRVLPIEEMTNDKYRHARALGYRSGLEVKTARQLEADGIPFTYEKVVAPFVQPAKKRTYTPDFVINEWLVVETKGRLLTEDRQKILLVKQTYPDLDIRLVFSNPNTKLNKRSQTTYADWCDRNSLKWAEGTIPESWLSEPVDQKSKEVINNHLIHKDKKP